MNKEAAYWMALAHLPGWGYGKINSLIIQFFHEQKISVEEFFQLSEKDWKEVYQLDEKQIAALSAAKTTLASNSFLAESMSSQGFEMIPVTSTEYSRTLKDNLKASYAPTILYVKGNKKLLSELSVAIVGSRTASEKSMQFTDNVAKSAAMKGKVVVSGFAKGVDKQALDSALKYNGQSIIVLPQGIMTFSSGFKQYYKQIVSGDVLVLSTFFPKAPWKVELAMARNPVIYGLANEIYVAESSEKGGTWSGVVDGFRKGRKIFVRESAESEKNANRLLIEMGATAVDFNGQEIKTALAIHGADYLAGTNELHDALPEQYETIHSSKSFENAENSNVSANTWQKDAEPMKKEKAGKIMEKEKSKKTSSPENSNTKSKNKTKPAEPVLSEEKIRSAFNGKPLSANELLKKLELDWTTNKLTAYLKKLDFVESIKTKSKNQFKLKGTVAVVQPVLFD